MCPGPEDTFLLSVISDTNHCRDIQESQLVLPLWVIPKARASFEAGAPWLKFLRMMWNNPFVKSGLLLRYLPEAVYRLELRMKPTDICFLSWSSERSFSRSSFPDLQSNFFSFFL